MPAISLVVCLFKELGVLKRLLKESSGLYDDLVVVHDGPEISDLVPPPPVEAPAKQMALDYSAIAFDAEIPSFYNIPPLPTRSASIHELVMLHEGRYIEGPRCYQQEPHWPFSWWQAKHDWILRLDADEFPGEELKDWLRQFRNSPEPRNQISGYTCIWPLWNGRRPVMTQWPSNRIFLFNRQRVRFFGMVEQVPIADGRFETIPLVLEHRPQRKSYGLGNLLLRRQAYRWRRVIAQSLLGKPTDLPCWRWTSERWPQIWEDIRQKPLRTAIYRLLIWSLLTMRNFWRYDRKLIPAAAVSGGTHHCLIAFVYWRMRHSALPK
jgi:hypothetical protein